MKWLACASIWVLAAGATAQEPGQVDPKETADQSAAEDQQGEQSDEKSFKEFQQELAPIIPM